VLDPKAKVVAGFQPIMPSFRGQVDEEGVLALIAYIRSLGEQPVSGPAPNRPPPANAPPAGTKVK
jgi:cytochrome c oxidase subunit 2